VFLDEFNKTLVAAYELDDLLKKSIEIVEANIKPAHCLFVINETENTKSRIMGSGSRAGPKKQDIIDAVAAISHVKQKLIVADELEDKYEASQKLLRDNDIVLVARLAASSSGSKPDIGYLILGPKKSGNLYSSQDIKVIEIVANELVIAVQNALRFEEIENFNITLLGKVDEATRKLRRVNERLKMLDEAKDDFISMASHQLRTPLTSIKGYTSMVLEGDAGKLTPSQKKLLTQSFFSAQRMVYLIADLLNVSRLKTGKVIVETTPVNLAEVVGEELEQLKETAAARSLTLTYKKPKKFTEIMLDETKIRQVIMNFVDNAIYYTPAGGQISVELVETPATIELRVQDNGIGVPRSEQPHLFTKFYRAGNARKARPDGTGLGLFMAKKVIVVQGGSLIFESTEGKGSTFGFVFSKHKLAVPTKLKQ
jgi:signal transduction histidine kinase